MEEVDKEISEMKLFVSVQYYIDGKELTFLSFSAERQSKIRG